MANKKGKFEFRISDENILMVVLATVCFAFGIWNNYRQLWLEDLGMNIGQISRVLSVALICSSIICFFISVLSKKVKIKNVVMLALLFRIFSFVCLLFFDNLYLIKVFILLGKMSDVILSIALWPLIATVNKSDKAYKKHALVSYLSKDIAIIFCGIMIGVTLGNYVFDLNTCLILAMISSIIGFIILAFFDNNKYIQKSENLSLKKSIKMIMTSKTNIFYLCTQLIGNIAYGMIFGMTMLILTTYIDFNISFASLFIIVCNVIGSVCGSLFISKGKNLSIKISVIFKYGIRGLFYLLAALANNWYVFVASIVVAYATTRILDDKVNGTYLNRIETGSMFLFGNLRYFLLSIGEGIGVFLAGIILNISFRYLFAVAGVITIVFVIMSLILDSIRKKEVIK